MLYRTKLLAAVTAVMAFTFYAFSSLSQTTTRTTVTETVVTNPSPVNFVDFDMNRDGIISINEVGEKLFYMYDVDGNEVIDNNEFEQRVALTILPLGKETVIFYDVDGDGITDTTQYTYENFLQNTLLARFDQNRDGLSPREFTGRDFMLADVDNDKMVELKEWQGTYIASIDRENQEKARFN